MNVTIKRPIVYDVKTIHVKVYAGSENYCKDKLLCVDDNCYWKPVINVDTGYIMNWNSKEEIRVFIKARDEFECSIKDIDNEVIYNYEGYVPDFMSIESEGFGDYIDLIVEKDGKIRNWHITYDDILNLMPLELD